MADGGGMPDVGGWDETVDAYATFAERDTGAFAPAMVAAAAVARGDAVLDLAAGTGALTLPLAATGARVAAVDWSPGMVAFLARRLREAYPGDPHRAEVMDGHALTFADASFDAALSLFGVMLFADFRAGLREMARVTRPGGRVVMGTWVGPTAPMRLFHDAVAAASPQVALPEPVAGMAAMGDERGMAAELTTVGLVDIRVDRLVRPWSATRLEVAVAAPTMLARMPPWPTLSDAERAATLRAMRVIADRDAGAPFESTALVGVGVKPG